MIITASKRKQFKNQHPKQLGQRIEFIPISRKAAHTQRRDLVSTDPWDIADLTNYFDTCPMPVSIRINNAVLISDLKLFVQGHFEVIKANNGNLVYYPYLERLQNLRSALINLVHPEYSKTF